MFRLWYTKDVETDAAGMVRTEFGNRICDLRMGNKWYVKRGYDPVTKYNLPVTHNSVFTDPSPIHDMDLENLFMAFQGENMSDSTRRVFREVGASHTSMSVGDVIEKDGKFFMVDNIGFIEL